MKRFALALGLAGVLLMPGSALAFHHGGLPARFCAAPAAGSPSNDNGMAKEALLAHHKFGLPLPPLGEAGNSGVLPPGNGNGQGAEHCAFAVD